VREPRGVQACHVSRGVAEDTQDVQEAHTAVAAGEKGAHEELCEGATLTELLHSMQRAAAWGVAGHWCNRPRLTA
jgi:hypothetical protein